MSGIVIALIVIISPINLAILAACSPNFELYHKTSKSAGQTYDQEKSRSEKRLEKALKYRCQSMKRAPHIPLNKIS